MTKLQTYAAVWLGAFVSVILAAVTVDLTRRLPWVVVLSAGVASAALALEVVTDRGPEATSWS